MTVPFCPGNAVSVPVCPDLGGTGLARVRNRDMSRCPVPSRSFPSAPCPDAMSVLRKLSANYHASNKFREAKAIDRAIAVLRKMEKFE